MTAILALPGLLKLQEKGALELTMRTILTTITFNYPFRLSGSEFEQPAGDYEIETDEELIEDISFLSYRRISTSIKLHQQASRPGISEIMILDPTELDAIIATDRNRQRDSGSRESGFSEV